MLDVVQNMTKVVHTEGFVDGTKFCQGQAAS